MMIIHKSKELFDLTLNSNDFHFDTQNAVILVAIINTEIKTELLVNYLNFIYCNPEVINKN